MSSPKLPVPGSQLPARSSMLVLGSKLEAQGSSLARSDETIRFEQAMVDFFVDAAELLGVPKSVAAIYGIVFASPEPLSFADIEARLDLSKGSISQGLRVLREVGALKVTSLEQGAGSPEPGTEHPKLKAGSSQLEAEPLRSRGVLYEPDLELRKLVDRFLKNRLAKQLEQGGDRLENLSRAVPRGRNGEAATLKERVKQLQNWNSKGRALLPVARTFLKLGG